MIDRKKASANVIELLRTINGSFAVYGTALGIIREGTIMEHDLDTDIAVFNDEFKWPDIAKATRMGYDLISVFGMTHYGLEVSLKKDGVKTDIMIIYKDHEKAWNSLWENGCKNGLKDEIRHEYPLHVMTPIQGMLDGVSVPTLGEAYLEAVYGDWKTPIRKWDWRTDHLCRPI